MPYETKIEAVKECGVIVVPGESTSAMIAAGLQAIKVCEEIRDNPDVNYEPTLVLAIFDAMCMAGDLNAESESSDDVVGLAVDTYFQG